MLWSFFSDGRGGVGGEITVAVGVAAAVAVAVAVDDLGDANGKQVVM